MGCVPPEPGFLEALRALCDASGALLVFDEVITGFRVARGGAQARFGVTPDLTILGKIVGGGLPLAAFGGRADVMEHLAPAGDVYQAGTLLGNPLATAAGLSVLRRLRDPAVYDELERRARAARGGPRAVRPRAARRRDAHALRRPTTSRVERFDASSTPSRYAELFRGLLERGIYVAPSQYECLFPSLAHGDEEIDATIEAVGDARSSDADSGTIAAEARPREPALGGGAARRARAAEPVFSPLAPDAARASGSRRSTRRTSSTTAGRGSSTPPDETSGVLLGDYLYAHGLVRIAEAGGVTAVRRWPS